MKLIYTLTLIFCTLAGFSQYNITGKIVDNQDARPLPNVTISVGIPDSSFSRVTFSDTIGNFGLNLPAGTFTLSITAVGHLRFDTVLTSIEGNTNLGVIRLLKTSDMLQEVVVKAAPAPVRQKGDTIEYNASSYKVNPDANAEDMIRKMPGVTIEQGTVKAGGEEVRKVTVDGREFFGDDATATLRNLPAEIIDKIQVFDRLSEQAQLTGFEDDQTAKGINIITKPNMRNGQFGRVYAGYGTDDRYAAGGNVSMFNGDQRISLVGMSNNINQQNFSTEDILGVTSSNNTGGGRGGRGGGGGGGRAGGGGGGGFRGGNNAGNFLVGQQNGISKTNAFGINFSDVWGKKVNVSGSYFFNDTRNSAEEQLNRQYFLAGDSSSFYNENSTSSSSNTNHRINMRIEYKMDSANTLIVTPNISFQKNNSVSHVTGINSNDVKDITSETGNRNSSFNNGYNISNNILFRHAFSKRGRSLTLGMNTGFSNRDGETYLEAENNSYFNNNSDSLQQFTDRLTKGYQLSGNISYTEPVGKSGLLQFSYRPSVSVNNSDQQTYQYDFSGGKYDLFDSTLSNKFDNTYTTHNAGINYRLGSKNNQFSVGLAYQTANLSSEQTFPYTAEVRRNFSNLLPTAMWNLKISPKSSLRMSYRSNTSAPSINQLQDVINNNNPLMIRTGNPDLRQQYAHNLMTRYTYTNSASGISLLGNVFVQKTNDYIGNATFIAQTDSVLNNSVTLYRGSQLMKPVNLDGYWNLRSFATLGIPVKPIKSSLNWNLGYSYSHLPGVINGAENVSFNHSINTGAVLASNISEFVDFNLNYTANFNKVRNSIQPELDNNYFTQTAGIQLNLQSKDGWVFQNDLRNQSYRGLTDGFNQNFWLWNLSLGKKFLKKQQGELRLSVFDVLKQNQSISRTIEETYIDDVQTRVLQQYFMLTFTYRLRNFGK